MPTQTACVHCDPPGSGRCVQCQATGKRGEGVAGSVKAVVVVDSATASVLNLRRERKSLAPFWGFGG